VDPAWPKEFEANHFGVSDPAFQRLTRCLGNLEPDRLACLALDHRCAFFYMPSHENIPDPKRDEVASTEFVVDSHIE
jgi:hypothetical protein